LDTSTNFVQTFEKMMFYLRENIKRGPSNLCFTYNEVNVMGCAIPYEFL
jgi:hypothetical protein